MRKRSAREIALLGLLGVLLALAVTIFVYLFSNHKKPDASPVAPPSRAQDSEKQAPPEPLPPPVPRVSSARPSPTQPDLRPGFDSNLPLPPAFAPRGLPANKQRQLATCAPAEPESGVIIVADEETPVKLAPSTTTKPLFDQTGGRRFLDPRHDLKALETAGEWVRVEIVAPRWPPGAAGWSGWVERKFLQRTDMPDAKSCLFIDPTKWKGATPEAQATVRETALRILREDGRCRRISRGGFLEGRLRFYLTCYPADGGRPYHYWISLYNIPESFAPRPLVDENTAIAACRKQFEKSLAHRAVLEQTDPAEARIDAFEGRLSNEAHYFSMDYRMGEEKKTAHCLVPRGGEAEITLGGE